MSVSFLPRLISTGSAPLFYTLIAPTHPRFHAPRAGRHHAGHCMSSPRAPRGWGIRRSAPRARARAGAHERMRARARRSCASP